MITGYRFLDATLDLDRRRLRVGETDTPLRPKAFDLMKLLVETRGRVVSKDELLDTVWRDTFVQEGAITRVVSELRHVLGRGRRDERYITTVSGVGYRFAPPVQPVHARMLEPNSSSRHPLVGRNAEIEAARSFFGDLAAGGARVLCLTGEPGIGKSSLLEALVETYDDPAFVITGSARSTEAFDPGKDWFVISDLVGSVCGGPESTERKRTLQATAPSWHSHVFGPAGNGDSAQNADRSIRELRMFLGTLAQRAPLVLFVDDAHWSDPNTMRALLYLTAEFHERPVGLVLFYRPTDLIQAGHPFIQTKLDLEARGLCREVPLTLLDPGGIREYLDAAFPGNAFPESFVMSLYRRTEGHPLFLSGLLDGLRADGLIDDFEGRWNLTTESIDMLGSVPLTVESMISRQISRLDRREIDLLTAAALRGPTFEGELLADALGRARDDVLDNLDALSFDHRLIHRLDAAATGFSDAFTWYRFSHALYRQTFDGSSGGPRRKDLCGELARRLDSAYPARDSPVSDRLALLCEEAGRNEDAARHWLDLGRRAGRLGNTESAIDSARRGIAMIQSGPESDVANRLELLLHMTLAANQKSADVQPGEIRRSIDRIRTLSRQIDRGHGIIRSLPSVFRWTRRQPRT